MNHPERKKKRADDSPTLSFAGDVATPTPTPQPEAPEHQFLPGARLGTRYRIGELLGRGGMGEVYRADDLQLGQTVALKFLPARMIGDPAALARLRNEVRVARQISHVNVCRVYDIGEADGHYFLTMESIDGEDLRSVLRRLGRPTLEKCNEIARQLCMGLQAAHETGVLHRDLKPANVMIDGRGQVRITDFGLAAFARELPLDQFAGTPACMAPELFAGGATSSRTDIYALGAVLYELYTGKAAFDADTISGMRRLHETSALEAPSEIVPDIEPVIEQMILRCLDPDPDKRPASAVAVAVALPGQDLVGAALAAGQTPSPEMVAAAGGRVALRPWVAALCLAGVVAGMLGIAALNEYVSLQGLAPPEKPAMILADHARTILSRAGYTDDPADIAYGWEGYSGYLEHISDTDPDPDRWSTLRERRPPVHWLWYREAPISLTPRGISHQINFYDPPMHVPGMAALKLDDRGRLAVLRVVTPQVHDPLRPAEPYDFTWLFEEAGLEFEDFEPADPLWNPMSYADARFAWTGHYPEQPDWPVRVEAASYAGRPIYLNVLESFDRPWTGPPTDDRPWIEQLVDWVYVALMVVALLLPPVVARRNMRRGTGDRALAMRFGLGMFCLTLVTWVLIADHTSQFGTEIEMFFTALGISSLTGLWSGLVYLALEPYIRRLWPQTLISWTRLLMGRLGDPRVGRDVLVGGLGAVLVIVVQRVEWLVPGLFGVAPREPYGSSNHVLEGGLKALGQAIDPSVLVAPLLVLLTLIALLFVLRRRGLAVGATVVLWALIDGHWMGGGPAVVQICAVAETLIVWGAMMFVLIRFGLLSLVTSFFFLRVLQSWPLTLDASAWFSDTGFAGMTVLALVALAAAIRSLGSSPAGIPSTLDAR
ncbi:MAG: serine/threonine protein kinase [bacterium]|nr:serine/threonine protein kinase [bacterium]